MTERVEERGLGSLGCVGATFNHGDGSPPRAIFQLDPNFNQVMVKRGCEVKISSGSGKPVVSKILVSEFFSEVLTTNQHDCVVFEQIGLLAHSLARFKTF
jgi:hypothetical protein